MSLHLPGYQYRQIRYFFAGFVLILTACAPSLPNDSGFQAVTAVPTLDLTSVQALCEAVATHWAQDWPTTIRALEALVSLEATCPDGLATSLRLYTAYYAYGTLLEQRSRIDDAIDAYNTALRHNPLGEEAAGALRRLSVFTPPPPQRCEPGDVMAALAAVPQYVPTPGSYVRINGQQFILSGQPFTVYGVNYYPRDYPWRRFLRETDLAVAKDELDMLKAAGFNTLRIFLANESLFICNGNGAVPFVEAFARLDSLIISAAERDFKLIVVLNDTPDLFLYPLYESPSFTVEQMVYIVERYRNEPAIMAWDLRDAGDMDYLQLDGNMGRFDRTAVLNWLTETTILVRQTDPEHLVTAGWRNDAEATIAAVDFVSFQHYDNVDALRQRIAILKGLTDKPIVLAAVGYSTFTLTESEQRDALQYALEAAENNRLAGWAVWTAFDFPLSVTCVEPNCPSEDSSLHHFGLWNTSYFPKLAVDAIEAATGVEQ